MAWPPPQTQYGHELLKEAETAPAAKAPPKAASASSSSKSSKASPRKEKKDSKGKTADASASFKWTGGTRSIGDSLRDVLMNEPPKPATPPRAAAKPAAAAATEVAAEENESEELVLDDDSMDEEDEEVVPEAVAAEEDEAGPGVSSSMLMPRMWMNLYSPTTAPSVLRWRSAVLLTCSSVPAHSSLA